MESGTPQIIYKNNILLTLEVGTSSWLAHKVSATRHANGKDWWILFINHKTGNFIKLLVTQDGATISEQNMPELQISIPGRLAGEMSFSTQGDRLAAVFVDKGIYVFGFDRCTGEIKKESVFPEYYFPPAYGGYPYGIAFSSKGRFLYQTTQDSLFQLDLATQGRKTLYGRTFIPSVLVSQLERGINDKIYMTDWCQGVIDSAFCHHLGVVNYPNKPYPYCQFERLGLSLGENTVNAGLPNMPVYAPPLPFAHAGWSQAICGGDSVQIGAPRQSCQYYKWAPAAGLSDTAAADPKAAPAVTTTYTLTTYIDGSEQTSVDSVTIYINPFANASISAAPDTFSGPPFTVYFKALDVDTTNFLCAWDFGDQTTANGATTSHTYDAIDGYPVKLYLQDFSGTCKDTLTYNLKLTLITGLDETKKVKSFFKVNPNPAREQFTIEAFLFSGVSAEMTVFDAKGVNVGNYHLQNGTQNINTAAWGTGIYYCKIIDANGHISTTKIIVLK